jgi:hypothetical protein
MGPEKAGAAGNEDRFSNDIFHCAAPLGGEWSCPRILVQLSAVWRASPNDSRLGLLMKTAPGRASPLVFSADFRRPARGPGLAITLSRADLLNQLYPRRSSSRKLSSRVPVSSRVARSTELGASCRNSPAKHIQLRWLRRKNVGTLDMGQALEYLREGGRAVNRNAVNYRLGAQSWRTGNFGSFSIQRLAPSEKCRDGSDEVTETKEGKARERIRP